MKLPRSGAAGDRRRAGQSVEARGPHRRLHLSAHRRARAVAAATAGMRSPARAAARRNPARSAIISPSSSGSASRSSSGCRRRTPTISARRSSGCICRSRSCPTTKLAAHAGAQSADLHGRRHDAAQAHGAGDRRRRDHQGVLSGVSAGQERRRGRSPGFKRRDKRARSRTPRGTSPASARRCSCCSASSDSCRTA